MLICAEENCERTLQRQAQRTLEWKDPVLWRRRQHYGAKQRRHESTFLSHPPLRPKQAEALLLIGYDIMLADVRTPLAWPEPV